MRGSSMILREGSRTCSDMSLHQGKDAVEARPVPPFSSSSGAGLCRPSCSVTALHEAGHVLVARFFGLPVKCATVVATAHFHGMVVAPDSDPNASPEELIEAAEALCEQVTRERAGPGREPRRHGCLVRSRDESMC